MIDYSRAAGLAFPKGKPKALSQDEKREDIAKMDKRENAKAKKRAGGRCEVRGIGIRIKNAYGLNMWRCPNKDTETHHLIGGIGRRNRGKSILAEYKLRVCSDCHKMITGKILQPTTAEHDAFTVRYRRAR